MKIGFISLGCAKNLVDSEHIIALFDNNYFEYESDPKKCDVILINTCGFILDAKKEAIDTILEMAEYKKQNLKKLIVTGCFVERYLKECKKEFKEVDAFIPIRDYKKLPQILSKLFKKEFKVPYGEKRKLITNSFTAYLKISDGCDNRCSYCAIPLIRGNNKSYPIEDIVKEAKKLYKQGVKELNIVAQDTTYYGHDLYNELALKKLLLKLDKIPFKWIRILYMYPDEIKEDLLIAVKKCQRVIPYFDIPIQYGNDRLLKLMNRRGSVELIKEKIKMIRSYFPDCIIRTTIIVGFPHETDKSFKETVELIKEVKFDSLGAFTYSKEDDTRAYKMTCQISEKKKQERYEELMKVQNNIILNKQKERIGNIYDVLIERDERIFNRYIGRSYMSAPDGIDGVIYIKGDDLKVGEYYKIKIVDYKDYDLIGEKV